MAQYIGFKLNKSEFSIPILKVLEIINTPTITALPQAQHYLKGVINLRGTIIPVLDLKQLISLADTTEAHEGGKKVIVIASHKNPFGVLVDEITSVINIKAEDVESPQGFMQENIERVQGVARFEGRLVILLDTDKLVSLGHMPDAEAALPDSETDALKRLAPPIEEEPAHKEAVITSVTPAKAIVPVASAVAPVTAPVATPIIKQPEPLPTVEAPSPTHTSDQKDAHAPDQKDFVTLKQIHEAGSTLSDMVKDDARKDRLLAAVVELIDSLAANDFEAAEQKITMLQSASEGKLFNEVGQVTRKLHDSIRDFRNALDPRIKQIADEEVPQAVDKLEFVIERTESAAHETMEIVEKYLGRMDKFTEHLARLNSQDESVAFIKAFWHELQLDLTSVMVAQEYQDITGQVLRRVIEMVNDIESELIGLIATFGIKSEPPEEDTTAQAQTVSQDDIDDLLKDFGF